MTTLSDLQIRRDSLIKQMASLQKRVTHGDKSVEFDLTQASTALSMLDREISRASEARVARHIRVRSGKDL
ncbi:MAG: hypothetical protein HQM00_05685 [Magnetococcales bacterium]|nr:hypothetical protein [Magnetococcales bacterium]